jgi:hypothetical protein
MTGDGATWQADTPAISSPVIRLSRRGPIMEQIVAKLAILPKRARRSATFDHSGE